MPACAQPVLPDGPGKAVVEDACQACHALTNITNAGHTAKDWDTVVHMMVNAGAKLAPDQVPVVVKYLAAHFPAKTLPAPQMLAGNVHVDIKEWDVPTQGSRPHDPMFAPDGSVWYTGQMANVLGRFDPKTQTFREFHLPDGSGPHGLIADHDGNVWYTANFNGITAIGDAIWYSESNTSPNTLVRFDTRNHRFQTWAIPSGGGVVRNMVATPEGNLWLACSGVNKIAFVEIGRAAAVR